MKKQTLLGTLVLVAVVGGLLFYATTRPDSTKAPSVQETVSLTGSSYVEHAQYYDIAVNYASSTPLRETVGAAADAMAVGEMKTFVSDSIAQFRRDGDFENITPETAKEMGFSDGRKQSFEIKYLIASSPRTVSYIFTVFSNTFGAHPNTTFRTFTFDTTTGARIALSDLFTPGSEYLSSLSQISRRELPGIIGIDVDAAFRKDFIELGTEPKVENFSNFFLDNDNLVILFDAYDVAPYVYGPQTLRIPLATLMEEMRPTYR